MSKNELTRIIADCCNDVCFEYAGKKSGVTSEVYDSIPVYQAWHGEEIKEYSSIDGVMRDKFYSGKSMIDLIDIVRFDIY